MFMRIEKVNDNQIRCTLTREDLDSRHMKLSELAYGTEKAKLLFREMMQQASYQYGFDAEDIPLMIEAVPISSDAILLIVTKVEYPEELDTRFSRFSEDQSDANENYDEIDLTRNGSASANDIIKLFRQAKEAVSAAGKIADAGGAAGDGNVGDIPVDITKMFVFRQMDDLLRLTHVLTPFYHGKNYLYKNPATGEYYLVVSKSEHTPEEFNKVCNILTEYGSQDHFTVGSQAYYQEHYELLIPENALEVLARI